MTTIVLLLLCATAPQDPLPERSDPAQEQEIPAQSPQVEALRNRIHEMRMNLILGGDSVRTAESEAIEFYGNRIDLIDQRRDTIEADISEKRATYDLTLERVLASESGEGRSVAMSQAQTLRLELDALDRETGDLDVRRSSLNGLISGVEARGREREKLRARLEAGDSIEDVGGLSLGSVGLAPDIDFEPTSTPFDDELLIQDLLARDANAARRLIFETDPDRYWLRFPLKPPAEVLHEAFAFPPPDLPGGR